MVFNQWTQWIISSNNQIFWHLNKITGNRANPFINEWVIIITQLFFFLSLPLSHTHIDGYFTGISPNSPLVASCENPPWEKKVLAGWLSGRAPWLPLNCKLLRWEKQVGGNLRKKRSEQSSDFSRERSVSHVMIPKLDRCTWSYLKGPEQVFSTTRVKKTWETENLQGFSTI